jgi:hypothetical protein
MSGPALHDGRRASLLQRADLGARLICRVCINFCGSAPTVRLSARYCRIFQEPHAGVVGLVREHEVGGCGLW